MALLAAAVWVALLAITGQQVECFNLDQNENVIRFFTGGNEPNSLFGFSLAPYSFSDNHTSILVGAPNESGTNATRTGAVYQCELGSGDNNCSRVVPFDSYTDQQVHKIIPNTGGSFTFVESHDDNEDAVDGQLLGYSIDAVNDYAIACAPHYSLTKESVSVEGELVDIPQYNGRCVVLQQGENISTPYAQFPFINILGSYFGNTLRSFGTGVKLTSIDDRTELFSSSLLSGSSNHPFGRLYTLTVDPPDSSFDSNNRLTDRGVNGYLGFHIEVGYVTIPKSSSDIPQVIASAPRDLVHRGSIYVFNDVYQSEVLELNGEETDGYFGYDFAVLSQTENDYDNLVVGCPLCSEEQGIVYYYGNINGNLENITLKILAPNTNQKGRFGISVENIGDLDKDGYQDVAIAAPLETGQRDDGTEYIGVVYIFRGISPTSIATEYSQVVYGYSSVPQFGYSLSGGVDLDDNTYPDLVIGGISTSSNSNIMILRAAPVVTVEADILAPREPLVLNDLPEENVCIVEGDTTVICFNVSTCFNYSLLSGDSVEEFRISYTLSSDSRVFTNQSDLNSGSTIAKEFTIRGEGITYCDHHRVYLQPNIAQLTDLRFQLSIADSSDPLVLQDGLHPVLNVARPTEWTQLVELNSTCKDIICRPDLELKVEYRGDETVYLNENFDLTFTITVTNNGAEDGFAFKVLIILPYRGITKRDEIPHQEDSLLSSCVPSSTNSTVLECPIKSPIASEETISFDLILVPIVDDIPLNISQLSFDFVCVDEQNADTDMSNNDQDYLATDVRSIAYYDAFISASGGDPLVAHEANSRLNRFTNLTLIPTDDELDDLGPLSPVEIIVRNDDDSELRNRNSPIATSEIFIFWPSQIIIQTSGDELLFPFLVPIPGELNVQPPDSTVCMYHDLFPSSLASVELANVPFPNATVPPDEELYPDYCQKNIKCGVIICEASNLAADRSAIDIFINSVLFSPSVTANQEVNISVLVRNKDAYPEVNDTMTTLTLRVQTAIPEVAEDCVEIYIPIVASIGGFVILVIIAVLLGFLGFFTRQNRFQRYLEESRGVHAFDDDESYAPRIVVPDHEYEASGEPQLISFGIRPPSCDPSIRGDEGMSNGKMSPPYVNGYRKENMVEETGTMQLATVRTDSSTTPMPQDGVFMEYTDSDIITTASSQKSLDKQPNNVERDNMASPTVSICSKETEL